MKGALLINKSAGMTSHDVIYQLRKLPALQDIKIGHSGTLDPFATGVLLVLLGGAVRLQDELHLLPKTYRAEITLGATTDTDDATGKVVIASPALAGRGNLGNSNAEDCFVAKARRNDTTSPTKQQVLAALNQIKHQTTQIPPNYSAIKLNGKKMYELARKGEIVEQKPRNITIYEIILEHYSYPTLQISVTCSTGTYIRAIARDIGTILGTGGYCSQLERTAIGNFNIEQAIKIPDIPENINSVLLSLEQLTEHVRSILFSDLNVVKLKNGREVEVGKDTPINTPLLLKNSNNQVFGIGIRQSNTPSIKPKKIFL